MFASVVENTMFDNDYVPKYERIYIWQIMITPQGMSLPIRKFSQENMQYYDFQEWMWYIHTITHETLASTYKTTVVYYCVPAFVGYILNTHCVNNDCICCGLKTT